MREKGDEDAPWGIFGMLGWEIGWEFLKKPSLFLCRRRAMRRSFSHSPKVRKNSPEFAGVRLGSVYVILQ